MTVSREKWGEDPALRESLTASIHIGRIRSQNTPVRPIRIPAQPSASKQQSGEAPLGVSPFRSHLSPRRTRTPIFAVLQSQYPEHGRAAKPTCLHFYSRHFFVCLRYIFVCLRTLMAGVISEFPWDKIATLTQSRELCYREEPPQSRCDGRKADAVCRRRRREQG